MIEIDCRKCENCKNGCTLYGHDPSDAVKACAAEGFKNYRPCNTQMDGGPPKEDH